MDAWGMGEVKKLALIQHIPGGVVLAQEVFGAVLRVCFRGVDFEVPLPSAVDGGGVLAGPVGVDG